MDFNQMIREASDELDADLLAYFADVERPRDDDLITLCRTRKRRKNCVLLLTTRGGDPSAAFRIARCLQMVYSPKHAGGAGLGGGKPDQGFFAVMVNSQCKSAGTLIALSADRLFMTGNAELGPLDVQLRKPDEVGERTSGLTPAQAVSHLQYQSVSLFKSHFTTLRFDGELIFSTKMAAEIATNLTTGLLSPIYAQIDPIRLAEVNRSLSVASEYASRLSRNLKPGALEKLVTKYPSHGFVIDREEAKELFINVEKPPDALFSIGEFFKYFSQEYLDNQNEFVRFINDPLADGGTLATEQKPSDGQSDGGSGSADEAASGGNPTAGAENESDSKGADE